ncbi:hypothetical protein CkaCkLH20_02726 [Colletotrichum karsti]|uniref:Uncharacterized protein n=1 Tax=Colletotrichum karsti TaxID=1095194 RepID=A0A9P6LNR1_9PEZI|nr:uncharacterized protein CkaCkLH20_02726 [Colletotrichum karsti]KAF9879915.1 hypothetical protein CkaCkLH20_02726 [Colletotrichum karsti]
MRFTSIIMAGVLAVAASAQSSGAATTTVSSSVPENSAQAAITKCLAACPATDVNCQSKCISVPSPNADQVNQTTDCVAKCDQGDGSAAATEKFRVCRDDCISKYYYTSGGTPAATGGSGSGSGSSRSGAAATATGSEAAATASGDSTATGSGTATGTNSASSGTSTPNAAPALVGSASFGVVGLIAAALL